MFAIPALNVTLKNDFAYNFVFQKNSALQYGVDEVKLVRLMFWNYITLADWTGNEGRREKYRG